MFVYCEFSKNLPFNSQLRQILKRVKDGFSGGVSYPHLNELASSILKNADVAHNIFCILKFLCINMTSEFVLQQKVYAQVMDRVNFPLFSGQLSYVEKCSDGSGGFVIDEHFGLCIFGEPVKD